MATAKPRVADDTPVTPQTAPMVPSFGMPGHDFTLQAVMELKGAVGELKEGLRTNQIAIERLIEKIDKSDAKIADQLDKSVTKLDARIEKIESKVSGISHKLYAAWVVTGILVLVGGWVFKEVWDITKPAIIEKLNSPKAVAPSTTPTKQPAAQPK